MKILVLLQPETVEHVARQDRQTGALCAERNRMACEIANGLVRAVGAHHEHAGTGIHRGQYFQRGSRPPDAHEGLVRRLSRDQRDIEIACLQQRNVLVAAFGVARFDRKARVGRIHHLGKGIAVEREAAAGRRRPQGDRVLLNGLASILRRSAARQQQHAGTNNTSDVHGATSRFGALAANAKDLIQG